MIPHRAAPAPAPGPQSTRVTSGFEVPDQVRDGRSPAR